MKTDKINSRKARGNCLLKNLGPNLQEALFEYMDGFGDEQGHTYVQCVAWLKQRGVGTNKSQLSKWRDWYLQRLCFQWCLEAVKHMMEDDALEDKYSDEQIQRKGNRMFSVLAMRTRDAKAWARSQTSMGSRQRMTLMERKFEFEIKKYDDQCAKEKQPEAQPQLTQEEKEARLKEIMGVD